MATNNDATIDNESDDAGTIGVTIDTNISDAGSNNEAGNSSPINPDTEPKRKRGRPAGTGKHQRAAAEAGTFADTGAGAGTRSYEKSTVKKSPLVVSELAVQLEALHKMGALVLKNPLVEISQPESVKLASALANVAKHYDFKINPAIMAWLQLVGVGAAIYGPRVAVTIATKKQSKASVTVPVQTSNAPVVNTGKMVYQ